MHRAALNNGLDLPMTLASRRSSYLASTDPTALRIRANDYDRAQAPVDGAIDSTIRTESSLSLQRLLALSSKPTAAKVSSPVIRSAIRSGPAYIDSQLLRPSFESQPCKVFRTARLNRFRYNVGNIVVMALFNSDAILCPSSVQRCLSNLAAEFGVTGLEQPGSRQETCRCGQPRALRVRLSASTRFR